MQRFNIFICEDLNPNYEKMTNTSDADAHLAYQKLFEARNIFEDKAENLESNNKKFDHFLDNLHTLADDNFEEIEHLITLARYETINKKKLDTCFLGNSQFNPLIYIDYETKKGLINLAKQEIKMIPFEIEMTLQGQSNYLEKEIPMLKDDLKQYQNFIKLINYYYQRKMLIGIIY